MRARLALAVSGQPCELREIVLRAKPAELLAASPKGTVPVLVLSDSQVIDQSLAIMHWALDRRDPEDWLHPPQGSIDEVSTLIELCDGPFKINLDRYKYPDRYDNVDPMAHRTAASDYLRALDRRLQANDYLFGPQACLADMAIAPFVRQFAHVDPVWFDSQPWPALSRWLTAFLASTHFARVMGKYAPWVSGTAGIQFPPDR